MYRTREEVQEFRLTRSGVGRALTTRCPAKDSRLQIGVLQYNVHNRLQHSPLGVRVFMSTTMTIRLDDEVKDRLDRLAASTQRSRSFLASEAIREFVEHNEWQIAEIEAALSEADAGDFASDDEVAGLARKWRADAR